MRLVHGTAFRHLNSILTEGLKPRGEAESIWDECPSAPDRVYLSNAYAFYFCQNAIGNVSDDALIIEVDVDRKNLFPDEDYMGQVLPKDHWITQTYPDLRARTIFCRDMLSDINRPERLLMADDSLELIGNVSHHGIIPPSRILRMARVPFDQISRIIMREFDPTISVMNYRFTGERYRQFQESLFERFPFDWRNYL